MSRIKDMTTGSPTKHILLFALPLIVTNFGQQLYMIIDAAIVGRGVGVKALAAVGATDWIYWLVLWAMIGLTQGFATFVSRYFGEKNLNDMNKTIAMSTILSTVMGTLMTAVGIIFTKPLLLLLNTPDDIIGGATEYLITMIAGTVIITAYNMAAAILRALGDGKTPLIAMAIAATLNIGLDLLFVLVFKWGIIGAAVASITAQTIAFIYCLIKILQIECIKFTPKMWIPDFKMIKDLLFFGLPLAFEYTVIAIGGIVLQSAINVQGSIFIAGYTATNKVYGLLESSAISVGHACSTFLSQNYGAKIYSRFKQGLNTALRIIVIIAAIVMTATLLTKRQILQFFIDVTETGGPQALETATRYLTIITVSLIFLYLIHIYRNALQAMKISVWSLFSGIVECIIRIVMSKIVINWIGSDALFISEPLAWIGALLSVFIPYLFYYKKLIGPNIKAEKKT